jgi:hypothetical protein
MGGERLAASLGITKGHKSDRTWHYIFVIPIHPI